MTPTFGQLLVLLLAVSFFIAGTGISLSQLWKPTESRRVGAKSLYYFGALFAAIVLFWHASMRGQWVPLGDNFETLTWLGLLLALFVLYLQRARPLIGLDWFLIPVAALFLILAAVFGKAKPQQYVAGSLLWTHTVTAYLGAAAFVIAGASGAMYLIVNRSLRKKIPTHFSSLERLEHITHLSVTTGFALLTIGLVTGLMRVLHEGSDKLGPHWFSSPKVVLTFAVWLIYAVILHAPLAPSIRGRKTAILSILGSLLMFGAMVAVNLMPSAGAK